MTLWRWRLVAILAAAGCGGDDSSDEAVVEDQRGEAPQEEADAEQGDEAPGAPGAPGDPNQPEGSVPADYADPTATTVVISPHDQCFDFYLNESPAVDSSRQYFTQDTDEEREVALNHVPAATSDTNHAVFVTEGGQAIGAVIFSISPQDVVTVLEVRGADCEELTWEPAGSEIESSDDGRTRSVHTGLVADLAGSAYEMEITIKDNILVERATVLNTEYSATINAVE